MSGAFWLTGQPRRAGTGWAARAEGGWLPLVRPDYWKSGSRSQRIASSSSADGLPLHCTGAVPAAIGGVRHTWPGVLRLGKMATGPAFLGEVAAALGPVACWWLQGGSKPLFAHVAFLSPRWVDLERPSQHHQGLVTGILVKILLLEELWALYVLRHSSSGHPNPQAARLMSPSCHRNIWDFFFPPVHLEAEHNHM